MNKEQRAKASKDQIERFFYSYYSHWRLSKILINEKILTNKYVFLKDLPPDIKQADSENFESLIAQELSNGLEFDTLSNCIQYIEDLFALLKAGQSKDYFIKHIVTYSAGQIENYIKQNMSDKELLKNFHFPYFDNFEEDNFAKAYNEGLTKLKSNILLIKDFYKSYHFFYTQYKHGLTIALRPYGNYSEEQIEKDKNNEMKPYLVAFDNLAINKISDNKSRFQDYIFMPCLTPNTQPFITQLHKEDNLMRYIMAKPNTTIESIKSCAIIVRECMHVFINNFLSVLRDQNPLELQLPVSDGKVYNFQFPVEMIKK